MILIAMIKSLLKKIVFYYRIFQGFSRVGALEWSKGKKLYKILCKRQCKTKNSSKYREIYRTYKKYIKLYPLSGKFGKLARDRLSLKYIFYDSDYVLEYCFQIIERNGTRKIISLQKDVGTQVNYARIVFELKRSKTMMVLSPFRNNVNDMIVISYENGCFYVNNSIVNLKKIIKLLDHIEDSYLIARIGKMHFEIGNVCQSTLPLVSVIIINKNGDEPRLIFAFLTNGRIESHNNEHIIKSEDVIKIDDSGEINKKCKIPFWEEIIEASKNISTRMQEFELIRLNWIVTEKSVKCLDIESHPSLPYDFINSYRLVDFILDRYEYNSEELNINRRCFLLLKEIYTDFSKRRGFMGFMMKNWQRDVIIDFIKNSSPLKTKLWAYKHGFFSFRVQQYNLNNANLNRFLSDKDYRKLRPINNEFAEWIYDKVIMRYILSAERNSLPEYYFHLMWRGGVQMILSMPDLPPDFKGCLEDIINILMIKGALIVKPSEGSHGEHVLRLEHKNGEFFLNSNKFVESEIKRIIENLHGSYVITEYVRMHPYLQKIYDKTTYTVRIMVINRNGNNPWIANAYIRIATDKTGVTDNIGKGGVCAEINLDTGELYNPEQIIDHVIMTCETHPDTGESIKGILPNWDKVKEGVVKISRYLFQIEYLGFDVVITKDSFKILEINTHQDLHRYPYYDKEVHEYFVGKKENKNKCMNL